MFVHRLLRWLLTWINREIRGKSEKSLDIKAKEKSGNFIKTVKENLNCFGKYILKMLTSRILFPYQVKV